MDRRAYGVNRHRTKQNSNLRRAAVKSGPLLGKKVPLTLENIALMVLPLVLMLIFIPPPNQKEVDNYPPGVPVSSNIGDMDSIIVYNVAYSIID